MRPAVTTAAMRMMTRASPLGSKSPPLFDPRVMASYAHLQPLINKSFHVARVEHRALSIGGGEVDDLMMAALAAGLETSALLGQQEGRGGATGGEATRQDSGQPEKGEAVPEVDERLLAIAQEIEKVDSLTYECPLVFRGERRVESRCTGGSSIASPCLGEKVGSQSWSLCSRSVLIPHSWQACGGGSSDDDSDDDDEVLGSVVMEDEDEDEGGKTGRPPKTANEIDPPPEENSA